MWEIFVYGSSRMAKSLPIMSDSKPIVRKAKFYINKLKEFSKYYHLKTLYNGIGNPDAIKPDVSPSLFTLRSQFRSIRNSLIVNQPFTNLHSVFTNGSLAIHSVCVHHSFTVQVRNVECFRDCTYQILL